MVWKNIRRLLFKVDAENIHHLALFGLKFFKSCPYFSSGYRIYPKKLWNIDFLNPLGLAAGFDKNGAYLLAWQRLGFGFAEIGTVTALAQQGNPKPRVFRLPEDMALMNRLGFNNQGASQVAKNLEKQRKLTELVIPIGVNIGKSKVTPLADSAGDYLQSFKALSDLADYLVINISSPNTQGLRDLQEPDSMSRLLQVICDENAKKQFPKPLLVKLAPDLNIEEARSCAQVAIEFQLSGLVISNTTISRENLNSEVPEGSGGISGKPLFAQSTKMLKTLSGEFKDKLKFIGVGGVTNAETAKTKLDSGADLLQAYTGFVYGGPGFVRKVLNEFKFKLGKN